MKLQLTISMGVLLSVALSGCGSKAISVRTDPNLKNMSTQELMDKVGFFENHCRTQTYYPKNPIYTPKNDIIYQTVQKFCEVKHGTLASVGSNNSTEYCIDQNENSLFSVYNDWDSNFLSPTYGWLKQTKTCLSDTSADEYKQRLEHQNKEQEEKTAQANQKRQNDIAQFEKYKRDAEKGDKEAQYNLGVVYQNGLLEQRTDKTKAFELFEKSAKQGYSTAQLNAGYMLVQGIGVAQNKIKAYQYFLSAAKQGNKEAQGNLDMLCHDSPWACK
jgi:hypothetical protein